MKAFNLHIFRLNVVCKCSNFWDFSNGKYIHLSKHVKVFLKSSTNGLQYIVVSFTIHVSQNCFAYLNFVHWYISSCRKSIILLNSEISYQKVINSSYLATNHFIIQNQIYEGFTYWCKMIIFDRVMILGQLIIWHYKYHYDGIEDIIAVVQ